MESVPEIAGSIIIFEGVEVDNGSLGNGYRQILFREHKMRR